MEALKNIVFRHGVLSTLGCVLPDSCFWPFRLMKSLGFIVIRSHPTWQLVELSGIQCYFDNVRWEPHTVSNSFVCWLIMQSCRNYALCVACKYSLHSEDGVFQNVTTKTAMNMDSDPFIICNFSGDSPLELGRRPMHRNRNMSTARDIHI